MKQQKEAACFKAYPHVLLSLELLVPKKETKSPVHDSFLLTTERRTKRQQEVGKRMAEVEVH